MHPADIQSALKKRGFTQRAIAAEIGVAEISVSKAIHRQVISDRIMRTIAEKLGEDPRRVFPEYYLRPARRKTSKVVNQ